MKKTFKELADACHSQKWQMSAIFVYNWCTPIPLWNKRIYKDVVDNYKKLNYTDTLLHTIQNKYNCYTIIPNLVIADVSESNIREGRNVEVHAEVMGWDLSNYMR